ncbi:DEAD/DEAH box helicase [Hylemonella gracilis]|uniref:DEAD/DEAH box helicase n=1 Tax=Hylemonella gracilis TaxID=80880 RepID=UPI0009DFD2EC|nr:ATP-binding domain-containing protein [Hylemonella gracilis]
MALQILPRQSAANAEPGVRELLEHLEANQQQLDLGDALAFYNFPLFREEEQLLVAKVVLISPMHGVVMISTSEDLPAGNEHSQEILDQLEGAFSQVFSRLVKYQRLRSARAQLSFPIDAFLWIPEARDEEGEESVLIGPGALTDYFQKKRLLEPILGEVFSELVSVLDGSKALIRPKERKTAGFGPQSKVALINQLEEEIRRFDRDQRLAYMTDVLGTQRIRGLAGSGKTVVLAMKAALTAIREPDARIAVTFYTKSLYQHIKQLITRFYRLHEDRDPDWNRLQVLHAWGGATANGLYYTAAKAFGHPPMTYSAAAARSRLQPFGFACADLLSNPTVGGLFDYVFVDEAQDFPQEFMRLALRLAREERLVIAYDAFQTIFDVDAPTAGSLFGTDAANEPSVNFDEDIILHKCYRNPREVIVCAHAIGFGIYGPRIVQMLESKEHWDDLGYHITSGELKNGEIVRVDRPQENSPSSISQHQTIEQIVTANCFNNLSEEAEWVASKIASDIQNEGVAPEDILVICADDRNAQAYFTVLCAGLAQYQIATNNLHADSFSIRDFQSTGKVTLSTIYKAKGNEAYVVFIMGIDALFHDPTPKNRNRAFTGMTRAKGWLRVSGMGPSAESFLRELNQAKANFPSLEFRYPPPDYLLVMKRDLVQVEPEEVEEAISRLAVDMEPEELEHLLVKKLREVRAKKKPRKKAR